MLWSALLVVVGLIAAMALGLAWLSREQRSEAAIFGGIGCACALLVGAAFFTHSSWLGWALGIVAGLGILAGVWGVVMAGAISRGINAMYVRDFEMGEPIRLDRDARFARVGSLILRHGGTESLDSGYAVTLRATLPERAPTEMVLRKVSDPRAAEATVDGYRVQLVAVELLGNKSAVLTSTVVVTQPEDISDHVQCDE